MSASGEAQTLAALAAALEAAARPAGFIVARDRAVIAALGATPPAAVVALDPRTQECRLAVVLAGEGDVRAAFAAAGVLEVWALDPSARRLTLHWTPRAWGYGRALTLSLGGRIAALTAPLLVETSGL